MFVNNSKNCDICDDFWFRYPKKKPYELASSSELKCSLYLCKSCDSFWLEEQRSARIIDKVEAEKTFPNFNLSEL